MEISIKTKTLKHELDKISKIFKKDLKFPMSRALSIEGYKNGLVLSARNMVAYAKVFIECEVKDPYFFSVDGFQFDGCLQTISEEDVKLKFDPVKENNLIMISGKVKTKIRILANETHPADVDYETVRFEKLPNIFKSINKVIFAASKDETKPSLNSVFLSNDHAVSTSGFLFAKSVFGFNLPFDALIPSEALHLLPDVFKKTDELEIGFTRDQDIIMKASMVHFKTGTSVATIRTLAKDYLNYGQVVSKYINYKTRYKINPIEIASALRAAKIITDKDERIIIDIYENGIKLSFENPEVTFEKFIDDPEVFSNPSGHCCSLHMKLDLAIGFFLSCNLKSADMLVRSNEEPVFMMSGNDMFVAMPLKPLSTR